MRELMMDEKRAVNAVATDMLDDVRAFDFANAPASDIAEFMAYTYGAICEKLHQIYDEEVPF